MAGQRSRHVQASIAAALVGLALSVAAWAIVWHRENQLAELELRERADDYALLLQYGIDEELKTLVGLRALLQSSDRVIGRREFETFAGLLLPNLPAIQNLIWIPRVLRADRDALEAEAARDGIPDYHIKSVTAGGLVRAEERDEYFPILYSTTARTTAPIFGLDLGSEPMRRAILERARDSGRPAATPRNQARRRYRQVARLLCRVAGLQGRSLQRIHRRAPPQSDRFRAGRVSHPGCGRDDPCPSHRTHRTRPRSLSL
jgi:CHASE1-domain containing sensor protein